MGCPKLSIESYYRFVGPDEKSSIRPTSSTEKNANRRFFCIATSGARYYDARIGRWTQKDPADMIDGPNLYLYVQNNPVNFIDSLGLKSRPLEEELPRMMKALFGMIISLYGEKKNLIYYAEEIFTIPWLIGDESLRIEQEEYGEYIDPFLGDYRHFLGAGMLTRRLGPSTAAAILILRQQSETDPQDTAAEWRGWRDSLLHPFTSLRELGKQNTVRPIGLKKTEQ